MRKINLLACLAIALLSTTLINAQATRTWVSGVGDDANPCSRTAPCKTFAGAISKTAAGGEIDALDPGGFGALTITKAITLDGGGGQVASILVSGTNGIVVAAQPADVVIIRNLRFDGLLGGNSTAGLNGIRWISGKGLIIENCVIFGFGSNGIDIEKSDGGTATIIGTSSENNGTGSGSGILIKNATNTVNVTISHSAFIGNNFGIAAQDFSKVTVYDTTLAENSNTGLQSTAAAGTSTLEVYHSIVSHSAIGLFSGNGSTVNIANLTLFGNAVGIQPAGGTIHSFTNNPNFNTTTGAPNGTAIGPQ